MGSDATAPPTRRPGRAGERATASDQAQFRAFDPYRASRPGRLPCMGARFVVLGETEAECADGLAELCDRLGAAPTTRPYRATAGRWIARAVPTTKAPDQEVTLSTGHDNAPNPATG